MSSFGSTALAGIYLVEVRAGDDPPRHREPLSRSEVDHRCQRGAVAS